MRHLATVLIGAAFLATACGPKALTLPDDPIDRAATCGVVAAAGARVGGADVKSSLTMEQQGQILHYPLLAGATTPGFSRDAAARVVARMSDLQESVTEGKWQELKPACDAAYPSAASGPVTLPSDSLKTELGCYTLAEFMVKALQRSDADYSDELTAYSALRTRLDPMIARGFRRAGVSDDGQAARRDAALTDIVKLGQPVPILNACIAKYPE